MKTETRPSGPSERPEKLTARLRAAETDLEQAVARSTAAAAALDAAKLAYEERAFDLAAFGCGGASDLAGRSAAEQKLREAKGALDVAEAVDAAASKRATKSRTALEAAQREAAADDVRRLDSWLAEQTVPGLDEAKALGRWLVEQQKRLLEAAALQNQIVHSRNSAAQLAGIPADAERASVADYEHATARAIATGIRSAGGSPRSFDEGRMLELTRHDPERFVVRALDPGPRPDPAARHVGARLDYRGVTLPPEPPPAA